MRIASKMSLTQLEKIDSCSFDSLDWDDIEHASMCLHNEISVPLGDKILKAWKFRRKVEIKRSNLDKRERDKSKHLDNRIKSILKRNGFKLWQLVQILNRSRSTYYSWLNMGTLIRHRQELKNGLNKLMNRSENYNESDKVKSELVKRGLTVRNLCQAMHVKRPTYYGWCRHKGFNGHRKQVMDALNHVIRLVK